MKFILTFILAFFLSFASAQRVGIKFASLSETGNVNTNWTSMQRCGTNRIAFSDFIRRAGLQSTRFQSRIQDSANCKVLSQLTLKDTTVTNYERWYGMSVYFGSGYPEMYEGDDGFIEFKRDNTDTIPPMVLSYHGKCNGMGRYPTGTYLTVIRHIETPDSVGSPSHIYINPLWAVSRNAWNDIVIRVKWANDTTGRIRIWLNGRYVYGYNGVTAYVPGVLKIGSNYYNWSNKWKMPTTAQTREIFIDEFRIATTAGAYLDVFPDSNDPAPGPTSANQFYQVVDNKIDVQKITFKIQQDTIWQSNWELRNAVTGKRMMSGSFRLAAGYRTYILNLPFNIPAGTYNFLVGTNQFMHVRKITKS
jgi:hypothetical protein